VELDLRLEDLDPLVRHPVAGVVVVLRMIRRRDLPSDARAVSLRRASGAA
jgi:hypothetical protein